MYTRGAQALEVVYPKKNNVTIYAKSTFLVGNIGNGMSLLINGQPVKTYKEGAFVHVVPLEYGENNFELKAVDADGKETALTYKINRPAPKTVVKTADSPQPANLAPLSNAIEQFPEFIYAEIVKDNAPLRVASNDDSARVSHLDKGTVLTLDAKKGEYYRVFINKDTKFWIKNGYVTEVSKLSEPVLSCIKKFKHCCDKYFEYFEFDTDVAVPFKIKEAENGVEVTLYHISNVPDKLGEYAQNIAFSGNILTFVVPVEKFWGYDCYHEGTRTVFRPTRPINADSHYPLKNLVITIDPGHGGHDGGSIGPTKVREADIVLDISKRLEKILKDEGAKPVMTRYDDSFVDLYQRAAIAKKANSTFCISIHANALPDGADPYKTYGTSVYYYYPQAKELAQTIKLSMLNKLGTRDDGTNYASFVMTRITSPISVLVETAYMINPSDYEKLTEEQFRQDAAQSVVDGLKAYMRAAVPK